MGISWMMQKNDFAETEQRNGCVEFGPAVQSLQVDKKGKVIL